MTAPDFNSPRQPASKSELPSIYDLTREVGSETLLHYQRKYHQTLGKFVRIGDIIILAPAVQMKPNGYKPQHIDILIAGFDHPDTELSGRVQAATEGVEAGKSIGGERGLRDAGSFNFSYVGAYGQITLTRLDLSALSSQFGRAGEAGRQETGQLAQDKLGTNIPVCTYL